jgi:hypothetical protein
MTMTRQAAWLLVVPALALLNACGGGGAAATLKTKATQAAPGSSGAPAAMPRVVSPAETSSFIVDPPAPGDATAFTESDIRSKFLADSGPGTTVQTIALARFTNKITLMPVPPQTYLAPTDPVDPQTGRVDHVPAIVVIGNGPIIPLGGAPGDKVVAPQHASIVAAFDPVTGQLLDKTSDSNTSNNSALSSLAVAQP